MYMCVYVHVHMYLSACLPIRNEAKRQTSEEDTKDNDQNSPSNLDNFYVINTVPVILNKYVYIKTFIIYNCIYK